MDSITTARRRTAGAARPTPSGDLAATTVSDVPATGYRAPKRPRRAYGDRTMATAATPPNDSRGSIAVSELITAMLRSHALDWASTQRANCRTYLLSPTGRFQRWCAAEGIRTTDDLTTAVVADFLAVLGDRQGGPGLRPATVAKYRIHLRAVARFQAETSGFGDGLADIDRIRAPRMATERLPMALTQAEEERVLRACASTRDHLIIELLLATGLRVSEAAALTLGNLILSARPPRVRVQGSVHDPECTKSRRPRQVPFRKAYATLPARLAEWIATERDPAGLCSRQELFLARGRGVKGAGPPALGLWGFEKVCQRISARAGVHFSPHVLRHTWATRLVNAAVQPLHLMEVGGWNSIEMVRHYYTPTTDEVLAAIAAAGA